MTHEKLTIIIYLFLSGIINIEKIIMNDLKKILYYIFLYSGSIHEAMEQQTISVAKVRNIHSTYQLNL